MIIDFLNIFEHPGADILTWIFGSFDTNTWPQAVLQHTSWTFDACSSKSKERGC